MSGNDWMFQRSKMDPAYSGLDRGYNSGTGKLAPLASNGDQVNAASRVIASPSGTNWAATFGANQGMSQRPATSGNGDFFSTKRNGSDFSFNLSPSNDQTDLSIGTDQSDFYRDRVSNMDLTKRDHELYGAGSEYGFTY